MKNIMLAGGTIPQKNIKKVVILGGGTAGWLTALLVQKIYSDYEIVLVESESIGILGAGEGTVPHFVDVLDFLQIPIYQIVKECSGTFKLGINFENWNGDGRSFFHGFLSSPQLSEIRTMNDINIWMHAYEVDSDEYKFTKKLAERGFSSYVKEESADKVPKDVFNLKQLTNFGMHFDAKKLASFLARTAIFRGVTRKEGILKSVSNNDAGEISSIELESGEKIDLDFIFDCSGFARLLIGKHFKDKWVSYKKHLPMKAAVPFFIPYEGNVKPQTDAIAMKYGWIWKIPVQGRYGCGYVYDSDYITKEQALEEAEQYFGHALESPKHFTFDPGSFENTVIKNCMAVGLSQSFVEPLEATSIWVQSENLIDFLMEDGINNTSDFVRNEINFRARRRNETVMDFLSLHYMTKRTDSQFWIDQKNKEISPTVQTILSFLENCPRLMQPTSMGFSQFSIHSYYTIALGLRLLDNKRLLNTIENLKLFNGYESQVQKLFSEQEAAEKFMPLTHLELITDMKNYVPPPIL